MQDRGKLVWGLVCGTTTGEVKFDVEGKRL